MEINKFQGSVLKWAILLLKYCKNTINEYGVYTSFPQTVPPYFVGVDYK